MGVINFKDESIYFSGDETSLYISLQGVWDRKVNSKIKQ